MIRIAIVENHMMFREGIHTLLESIDDFKVIGEYSNGKLFIDDLPKMETDIVLMDIDMPVMDGKTATQLALEQKPHLKIIALSMFSDQQYYYEMIRAGVSGFVLKESSIDQLETAIRNVHRGIGYFSPELLFKAVNHAPEQQKRKQFAESLNLSDRELDILRLICRGQTTAEISESICLSIKSIEGYKTSLLRKTGMRNSASLIVFAIKQNLVDI